MRSEVAAGLVARNRAPAPATSRCWPEAIRRIPAGHRNDLLIRADGACAAHNCWTGPPHRECRRPPVAAAGWLDSVGLAVTEKTREAIGLVPKKPRIPADSGDTMLVGRPHSRAPRMVAA